MLVLHIYFLYTYPISVKTIHGPIAHSSFPLVCNASYTNGCSVSYSRFLFHLRKTEYLLTVFMYKISCELKFRNIFHKNYKPVVFTVTTKETHLNYDSLWNTGAASFPLLQQPKPQSKISMSQKTTKAWNKATHLTPCLHQVLVVPFHSLPASSLSSAFS